MKREIVIVSSAGDPHVDDMLLKLREMGRDALVLDTDDVPLGTPFSFALDGSSGVWGGKIRVSADGPAVDTTEIGAVWWRRPGHYFGLPPELSEQEREFARGEIDQALGGLWASLDCYWVSHPEHIRRAGWKMEQLERAARLGFDVPRTLVTTDPGAVREFYDACDGQMVFKVLTDPFLGAVRLADKHPDQPPPEPRETKTTMITEAELDQLDSVRLVPCLFQEYVPKRLEYRVTVIGGQIFAAAIDSQAHEGTRIDWRNWADGGFEIPYSNATLPNDVAERCLALVRSYQLNFSTMDLILTPDGRCVFLENNPNGQFIFVEKLVPDLEMTAALASRLIEATEGSA
jgi:glutathione synthase/RimK-type ligase-like ATP-grasp enzyme